MGDPPEKMYVIPPKNKAKLGHRPAKTVERYSVKPHKIHEDVTINIAKGERYQPPATPIPYPGQQYPFPGQPGQPVQPSQRIPVEETIPRYIKQEPTAPMFDDDDDDDDDMGDEGTAPPFNEIQMDENIANYLHQKGVYGEFEKGEDGKWVYVIHNRNDHGDIIKTENPEDETPMGLELTIPNRGGVSTAITSVDSGKRSFQFVAHICGKFLSHTGVFKNLCMLTANVRKNGREFPVGVRKISVIQTVCNCLDGAKNTFC